MNKRLAKLIIAENKRIKQSPEWREMAYTNKAKNLIKQAKQILKA